MSNTVGMVLFVVLFGGFLAAFLWSVVRHGGFKGAMFHATILKTVGSVEGVRRSLLKSGIKVHILKRNRERLIGLELVSSSMTSYEVQPVSLTEAEAEKLVLLLQAALKKSTTPPTKETP